MAVTSAKSILLIDMANYKSILNLANKYSNSILDIFHTNYPGFKKTAAFQFYQNLCNVGLQHYFSPALPRLISRTRFRDLITRELNRSYIVNIKISLQRQLDSGIRITSDIFKELFMLNDGSLYKRSLVKTVYFWCKNRDLCWHHLRLHPQFWNVCLASHVIYWSRQTKNGKIKLFTKCLLCKNSWQDPFYHLCIECEHFLPIINTIATKDCPIPPADWFPAQDNLDTFDPTGMISALNANINTSIQLLSGFSSYNMKYTESIYKTIDPSENFVYGLNCAQFNMVVWIVHQMFGSQFLMQV